MKNKVIKLLSTLLISALIIDLSTGADVVQAVTVRPSLTAAAYDASTGVLSLSIDHMTETKGEKNDVDLSKVSIYGKSTKVTLSSKGDMADTASGAAITLSDKEQTALAKIFTENGAYHMTLDRGWNGTTSKGYYIMDTDVVVTNIPQLTSATYDYATGKIILNGSNLKTSKGINNDIVPKYLVITNGYNKAYRLTSIGVEVSAGKDMAEIRLNDKDKAGVQAVFDKDATQSQAKYDYQLFADYGWNGKITPGMYDLVKITVSNYYAPTVTFTTPITVVFKKKVAILAGSCNKPGTLYAVDSNYDLTGKNADDLDELVASGTAMKVAVPKIGSAVSLSTSGLKMTADEQLFKLVLVDYAEHLSAASSPNLTVSNVAADKLAASLSKPIVNCGTSLKTPKYAENGNTQYYEITTKLTTPKRMTDYTNAVSGGALTAITGSAIIASTSNDIMFDTTSYTGKYMTVYELNVDYKLIKFTQIALTSSNVRVAATVTSAVASGSSITYTLATGKFGGSAINELNWVLGGTDSQGLTVTKVELNTSAMIATITVSADLESGKEYTITPKKEAMYSSYAPPVTSAKITVQP